MGADQVLSARVVLASGEVVKASRQENPDLFFAIRGGGGGTYAVVTEITVKTYPTHNVNLFYAELLGQGFDRTPQFLDAMETVYASFNQLSEVGFGGYGYWTAYATIPFRGYNATNVWAHAYTILDKTEEEAKKLFQPFQDKLDQHNLTDAGFVLNITHKTYPSYAEYFDSKVYTNAMVGGISALSSRLLDSDALSGKRGDLREAMDIIGGRPEQLIAHTIVHHGLQTAPSLQANDSAVQPGWYGSTILDIFETGIEGFSVNDNEDAYRNIRETVHPVYQKLSPNTGTYMNEADFGNADWQKDFYGYHFDELSQIKAKHDPDGVFYCPTCIGSEAWIVKDNGALCKS